jgi:hypothetical protein
VDERSGRGALDEQDERGEQDKRGEPNQLSEPRELRGPDELHALALRSVTASDEGRSELALATARTVSNAVSRRRSQADWSIEELRSLWILAAVWFGLCDELIEEPAPPPAERYAVALWRFARAMAFAGQERLREAQAEYDTFRSMIREPATSAHTFASGNAAVDTLAVSERILGARVARLRGLDDDEIEMLFQATRIHDSVAPTNFSVRYLGARRRLGAALLRAARAREAELVLREQLAREPADGWSLYGLALSLKAQDKEQDAEVAMREFRLAWKHGDLSPDILYR